MRFGQWLAMGIALFLACSSLSWATISEGEAVNRAGQQRMLSQRMAKNWSLLAQKAFVSVQQTQMEQAMQRFDDNLKELRAYDQVHGQQAQVSLVALTEQWQIYQAFLRSSPMPQKQKDLLVLAEKILQRAETVVQQLTAQHQSSNVLSKTIAVSGRQRMLSQRIVLLYAARDQKNDPQTYQQAISAFSQALVDLKKNPKNTPEIRKRLQDVEVRWNFAQHIFSQPKPLLRVLEANCELLLKEMDEITSMYAGLSASAKSMATSAKTA